MFFRHTASPATPIYTANAISELDAAKVSRYHSESDKAFSRCRGYPAFHDEPKEWREYLLRAIRPSAENLQAETREKKARLEALGYKELQAEFDHEAYLQALEIRESQHTSKSSDAFACPPKGAMHLQQPSKEETRTLKREPSKEEMRGQHRALQPSKEEFRT